MIVKAEIQSPISIAFWKGLSLFRKGLALFLKRHSTLLSRRIRRVTRGPPWGRSVVSRWNWVPIDKANQKLQKKLKSSRRAFSSGRLCSDVDGSSEIFHGEPARDHPSICCATRLYNY